MQFFSHIQPLHRGTVTTNDFNNQNVSSTSLRNEITALTQRMFLNPRGYLNSSDLKNL